MTTNSKYYSALFSWKRALMVGVLVVQLFFFLKSSAFHPFISENVQFNSIIEGPERLCIVFGSVIGDFVGLGETGDVYSWRLVDPNGQVLFDRSLGSSAFSYTFSLPGTYQLRLDLKRGNIVIKSETKTLEISPGPIKSLANSYILCNGNPLTISAIDPSSANFGDYVFKWRNEAGALISSSNNLTITNPGIYQVEFYFVNSLGENECITTYSTNIFDLNSFDINSSTSSVCPDQSIEFISNPSIIGNWYLQKKGELTREFIQSSEDLLMQPGIDLEEPGNYIVIFEIPGGNNPDCLPIITKEFTYNPEPRILLEEAFASSDCSINDGILKIRALTDIDLITIDSLGISQGPFNAGEIIEFPNLKSGAYSLNSYLGNCTFSIGTVVPLANPIPNLEFIIEDIQPETCTPTGKAPGQFSVILPNGETKAGYRVLNERGYLVVEQDTTELNDTISIQLGGGKYFFELFDENNCSLPNKEEIEIPGLDQVTFSVPEKLTVCQSYELFPTTQQNLEFTLVAPDGTETIYPPGNAVLINQEGKYQLIGRLPGQSELCPLLSEFDVILVEPIEFEPKLIEEDCFGNRTYEADIFGLDPSLVKFTWINEMDEVVGNGQFLFPTSTGDFKLDVQPINSLECPNNPKNFFIKEPVLSVDVNLEATKLCEFGPKAIVDLTSTFPEEVTDIEWRRYDDQGNIEDLPQFKDQWQIIAEIAGVYEASVYSRIPSINKNCELGRKTIELDLIPDKVPFDVPSTLSLCDPYPLIPNSSSPLEFALTFPDGTTEIKGWNEPFTIELEGTYTLLGYDPNIKGPLCPDQKTIEVRFNEPVDFTPILVNLSCEGEYLYEAQVTNYPPDQVDYFWTDPSGVIVATTPQLSTSIYGVFTLEVQPSGSLPCANQATQVDIPTPQLSIEVNIQAETLCPDQPDAALKIEADLSPVATIEWWFTDLSNNQIQLTNFNNDLEILATQEGTYEVRTYSPFGCFLGSATHFVIRSTDQVRPILEAEYQVCPKYEIAPTLNPGNFAAYEWYFGDNLVSTSSTFKPLQIGTYFLIVYSAEGCAYETTFTTIEECELEVSFPNALMPSQPDKQFLAYTNYLVDELEIWVFNKWGNLIFHCQQTDLQEGIPACIWDGTYNGEKIPPGSYAIRVYSKNLEKNLERDQREVILILE